MHRVFAVEGLVVHKKGIGESNMRIALLTSELGLLRASVRSARKEVSKLRYGIEPLTSARFSLVRGRHDWILTGVERISRDCISSQAARRQQAGKVVRLLLRLIRGEEKQPELLAMLQEGLHSLAIAATDADAEAIEYILVLRLLAHLGYLPDTAEVTPFLTEEFFSLELSEKVKGARPLLVRAINESLEASGL